MSCLEKTVPALQARVREVVEEKAPAIPKDNARWINPRAVPAPDAAAAAARTRVRAVGAAAVDREKAEDQDGAAAEAPKAGRPNSIPSKEVN